MVTNKSDHPTVSAEQRRERIGFLLVKYPEINAEEEGEIKRFLESADATALGLLSADSRSRSQLQRFRRDQRASSPFPKGYTLIITVVIVLLLGLIALLWKRGAW